jgi:hypothetical protein
MSGEAIRRPGHIRVVNALWISPAFLYFSFALNKWGAASYPRPKISRALQKLVIKVLYTPLLYWACKDHEHLTPAHL